MRMVREILTGVDNEILRKKSQPVKDVTKDIRKLIRDMEETLEDSGNGIGLAAPQVGVHLRVILITLFDKKDRVQKVLPMINPSISAYSAETIVMEEGCLSVPDYFHNVRRPRDVEVTFLDEKGKTQTLHLTGLHAREVQHEIDHLDGILFTDLIQNDAKTVIERIPEQSR